MTCSRRQIHCCRPAPFIDLTFTSRMFFKESKSNGDIIRALVVLRICAINAVVKHNERILAGLRTILGQSLFKKLLKRTFFGHFVAGEDREEIEPVVLRLKRFGVKSILDYSVESDLSNEEAVEKTQSSQLMAEIAPDAFQSTIDEKTLHDTRQKYAVHKEFADRRKDVVSARTYFYEGEHMCDRNRDLFMETVDAVAKATQGQGFAAVKLTALGRPTLLLKLSESIAQTHNFFKTLTGTQQIQFSRLSEEELVKKLKEFGVTTESQVIRDWFKSVDFDGDGYMDFHGWSKILDDRLRLGNMFKILNMKTGQLEPMFQNLTAEEENEFTNMVRRLVDITEYAISKGVRVMVDAEQTYFQPAISRIVLEMMRRYNRQGGNVFNTYQAYLRNTLDVMECDMQLARREGWHFGLKLVRGAYMEQERKRAVAVGYPDPINPDFESTSRVYHACLERLVDEHNRRGKGAISVMIASHNEDTIRFAINLMRDRGIAPSEKTMCFAQLYGMCDQVSFSLGHAGYSVYKYLPYGPVEKVLPYLSRRAIENSSILKKANKEQNLLRSELWRRLLSGQFLYKVPSS
ncbi:proline dehydrogenase [Dictyocaulus viviparus]|uniref:Proline dehydrogenase n=1 Tax=Dictyocaulus viviparus TaxID=29172 RepID=A0A0D8XS69_DICVI|nr:proline dehydrogenase [Dictyocaulus viviparus]